MNDRIAIVSVAILSLLGIAFAPWAALARQTGAKNAVLLLPNRYIDFTARTELLPIAGLNIVLILSLIALLVLVFSAFIKSKQRYILWFISGLVLLLVTSWGLSNIKQSIRTARVGLITTKIEKVLENPKKSIQVEELKKVLANVDNTPVSTTILRSRYAGFTIKRLPYEKSGLGLAAFLAYISALLAIFLSFQYFDKGKKIIENILRTIAVPLSSILLSLLAAAVVILLLQATPTSSKYVFSGWQDYLAGRLETLWYAYYTLFANSLSSVGGIAESLKFSTPLIFTGLAVALGFQAGLFNIGAPGQMVLGAIFAMLAGLYLPGPRFIVLPLTVLAAALGGAFWGAIPGWLKARFGANEVINTILMNYIASALLLFMLSSALTFAPAALRIIYFLAALTLIAIILNTIPFSAKLMAKSARLSLAAFAVIALIGVFGFGYSNKVEEPIVFDMPFKAPGSEPKSYEIQDTAKLGQLADFLPASADTKGSEKILDINYALFLAIAAFIISLLALLKRHLKLWQKLLTSLVTALLSYGLLALLGFTSVETVIPATNLNLAFLLAIAAAIFVQYFMWHTKWGYELRAVGPSPKAAEYGGASIAKNTILSMTLSGMLAGLTATHYVLGGALEEFALRQTLPTGDGFDGIAVALLGGNTPLGVVLSAFLFGILKNGGIALNVTYRSLTRDVVSMILALVVLFIAAKGFLPDSIINPINRFKDLKDEDEPQTNLETK